MCVHSLFIERVYLRYRGKSAGGNDVFRDFLDWRPAAPREKHPGPLARKGAWSLLILRDAMFGGFTRFSQFQKSLGIATNVLTKRLEDFVAAGLMERRQPSTSGAQAEYMITRKGLELKPVIIALTEWGDKWPQPGPAVFQDESGQRVELQLRRAGDDAQVGVASVVARRR